MAKAKRDSVINQARPGIKRAILRAVGNGKLLALLLAAASGGSGYLALTSPRFIVHAVKSEGNRALSESDVSRYADVVGQWIWFVRTGDIQSRIADNPYVASVVVRLQLPDAVVVKINERQPDIRWLHDGKAFAVTQDGLIVDQVDPSSGVSLTAPPTVTAKATGDVSATVPLSGTVIAAKPAANVITIVDTTPGRPLKVRDVVDADALELARRISLRAGELGQPITRLEWDGGLGVSVIVGDGRQAAFGNSQEFDRKWATLRFLLKDGTPFKFLDLRPNTPYYR